MSEWNTIYNINHEIVGTCRHGIAWSRPDNKKLGEYDDHFIYNKNKNIVGKIVGNQVVNLKGEPIGNISNKDLFVEDKKVGSYIGSKAAGFAAIALLFST